jgi:hypothetical protein
LISLSLGCLGCSNNNSESEQGQPEFRFHENLFNSEDEFIKRGATDGILLVLSPTANRYLVCGQTTLVTVGCPWLPAATRVTLPLPSNTQPTAGGINLVGLLVALLATG